MTQEPGAANASWARRSRAAVWHPCSQMKQHERTPLVPIARASGAWLYDFDGGRYLDAVSSWWVNLFGHGEPRIRAAIEDDPKKPPFPWDPDAARWSRAWRAKHPTAFPVDYRELLRPERVKIKLGKPAARSRIRLK